MPTSPTKRTWILLSCTLLLAAELCVGQKVSLPTQYNRWLNEEVPYIITGEEREAFLTLTSDKARDEFIERFWAIRNPDPGAPTNSYKDEHFRRLAYANQYFGWASHTPGWRTAQGRVYITLGEPKQKAVYYGYNKLHKMEIWFYSNAHPALPPFFYVVFYQRDDQEEFRLYSPYADGPERLVNTDSGSRSQALHVIEEQAGREVARTALSLLPDEPVDFDGARPTLQSDILLSTIQGLANHPLNKELLNRHRQMLESVTHRVVLGQEFMNAMAVPLRDAEGNFNLHCLLHLRRPEDFTVAKSADGRLYYAIEVAATLKGEDGKEIYVSRREISRYLSDQDYVRIKGSAFGVGLTLPITPGKFNLEFTLTNKIQNTSFRSTIPVLVPEMPTEGLAISGIVPFTDAAAEGHAAEGRLPFSGGGVRFTPLGQRDLQYAPGQNVDFFYQLWSSHPPSRTSQQKLVVEYAYGRLGITGDAKTIREEVNASQFDASGSMVNGKRINLQDVSPGNYRLMVTVIDPQAQQKAFTSINFRVLPGISDAERLWYIYDERTAAGTAQYEFERALSLLANHQDRAAELALQRALEASPSDAKAISKLVELYTAKLQMQQIATAYQKWVLGPETDEQTLLRIANALARSGYVEKAIGFLEQMMRSRTASAPLCLALSNYYRQLGNAAKADEFERRGRSLLAASKS